MALVVKNPPVNSGDIRDAGLIPGSGRSPGGRHDNPLQYSCLENPMDRGAWQATVHRVTKSQTQLKRLSSSRTLWGWVSPLISGYWSESLPACTQGRRKSISNPPILQIGMNYDSKHGLFMYIFVCMIRFKNILTV